MGQENKNMMKWEETNDGSAVVERMDVDDDSGEHDLICSCEDHDNLSHFMVIFLCVQQPDACIFAVGRLHLSM